MIGLKTSLPESLAAKVKATTADWQSGGKMQRLWRRDATLWSGADEANWLGWLDIVDEQVAQQDQLQKLAWTVLIPLALAQIALTGIVKVMT